MHKALYRVYRPKTFGDVVGQEHIVKTLKNQIKNNNIGHAYLFSGTRGTGKTSTAKIFARAVNCLNPINEEPCNECEICIDTLNDNIMDIVEIDAASNNSVDDIRELRESVKYTPSKAKYKVYIIDEVHMLSQGAFNALLKTLEEPPSYVIFILATTEPHKIPATILSRCQRFDFKKISNDNIEKRLNFVCEQSNIDITPEAKKLIAILAEGAMRDALSILERCMQEEGKITEDLVKELVGIPKTESVNKITKSILQKNTEDALGAINEIISEGKDISNFLWEIIKYVKDILVFKTNTKLEIYSEAEKNQIKELADSTTKERLISMIYELSNLQNDMKWSSQKLIMFQVTIIKLCNEVNTSSTVSSGDSGASSKEVEDLKYKINRLEKQITQLQNAPRAVASSSMSQESKTQYAIKPEVKKSTSIKLGDKVQNWPKIIDNIKQEGRISLSSILMTSSANEINDMTVGINFENGLTPFRKDILEKPENMSEIVKQVSMELGKPMRVVLVDNNEEIVSKTDTFSDISNGLDIPINIID